MKKCAIIYNPKSGKHRNSKDFMATADQILRKYQYEPIFFKTLKSGDATNIVYLLEDDYALVIIAGGDGTLNEGITGNLMRKKRFVIAGLPIGTTNDVGSMYGYTKNYKKDLELLLNGKIKKIDTCFLNDKPFLYIACLGNYVDVSYTTPRSLKEKFGRLGYFLYGAKQVREKIKQYQIEYEVDGQKYEEEFSFLFITNSSRIAGIGNLYDDVKLNDGMFEVAFCKAKKKSELIKMLPSILSSTVKKIPGITYYKTNYLKINFKNKSGYSWCVDGEEFFTKNEMIEFKVHNEMEMLVPTKNIQKLFEGEKL